MNKISYKLLISFLLIYVLSIFYCTKPQTVSIENILPKHQWRKTKEAVYNSNNKFEKYIYNFENAEDCEKNSYWMFGKYIVDTTYYASTCHLYNLCNNNYVFYKWYLNITKDSIRFKFENDIIHTEFSRFIEYYDERSFVLRYDSIIENKTKIIKETYFAFD